MVLGPGKNTYSPRFSAGAALGVLEGCLPVRYGIIYGGPEKLASAAGVGLDAKYLSIDASYKAVGSPALLSKKGFEASAALSFRWGWKRKKIIVKEIPKEAPPPPPTVEPVNSVIEPYIPAFEAIPAEDDFIEEEIYEPIEIYITMFMPEPIPEPGLPPPPQPTVEETETLNTSQRAINFRTGGAELTESSYAPLEEIANLLKQYPHIRYEIQGHTDSQGAEIYNLLLSAERAAVVKYFLMSKGAPEASLVSIGYGKNMPAADNNTVVGRAQNRRVEFVQILSQEHYDTLKTFEMEMMKKLTERALEKKKRYNDLSR
jgi:outer membrane protein OmpA-like peptidoglycan-associated protein